MTESDTMRAAAILMARSALLNAKVAGMQARNALNAANGLDIVYSQEEFEVAVIDCDLGTNSITLVLRGEC